MPERRMASVAISLAAGILAAEYVSPAACLIAAGAALIAAAAASPTRPRATVAIIAAAFALGALRLAVSGEIAADDISRLPATAFEGVVASDPDARIGRVQLIFTVNRAKTASGWTQASGRVMVNLYKTQGDAPVRLEYGDMARITAYCYQPRDPTNPGQFSWKDYLARQGIYTCASVRNASQVRMLSGNSGNPIVRAALAGKHYLTESIGRIHPRREASVIVGMVLGTYSYLPPEIFRNFSRSGTLHLLAASGYNCWILLALATPVLSLARVMPKYRSLAVILLLAVYLIMVGPKPSLVRASIMAALLLAAGLVRRAPNLKTLFFAAAVVVLLVNPSDLFDIGFQLSFLAVWGLLEVAPVIEFALTRAGLIRKDTGRFPARRTPWLRKLTGPVAAAAVGTTACTLITAPVVAQYFNYVSLVSLPANAALALGVPVVFAAGLLSPIGALIAPLGSVVGWVGTATTDAMLTVVNYLGSGRCSAVSVASPGMPAIVGYYLVLYAALSWVRSRYAKG